MTEERRKHLKKPDWLKIKLSGGKNLNRVKEIVKVNRLRTIWSNGNCPNTGFYATKTGKPLMV